MIEKFAGFFDPTIVKSPIHIIGCGAIGSTLAVQLTRCGLTEITLWDFDVVQPHNLANQQYRYDQIGCEKNEILQMMMEEINPQIKVQVKGEYTDEKLAGYVFMAVDSIDVRKTIVKENMYNQEVLALFDFRMRLKDAQTYGVDWTNRDAKKNFVKTMDFTQEEADAATPVNACGMTLSVIPTVETVVASGVANFINYLHAPETIKPLIMINPFDY